MNDWFFDGYTYPSAVGHRGGDTDKAAAEKLERSGRAFRLRERVETLMESENSRRGLTADEAAEKLGESILAIRPRFTELKKSGKLADTGQRRKNEGGSSQRVLAHSKFIREGAK